MPFNQAFVCSCVFERFVLLFCLYYNIFFSSCFVFRKRSGNDRANSSPKQCDGAISRNEAFRLLGYRKAIRRFSRATRGTGKEMAISGAPTRAPPPLHFKPERSESSQLVEFHPAMPTRMTHRGEFSRDWCTGQLGQTRKDRNRTERM